LAEPLAIIVPQIPRCAPSRGHFTVPEPFGALPPSPVEDHTTPA